MGAAPSAPQGAHFHVNVIPLLPYLGIKKEAMGFMVLQTRPSSTRPETKYLRSGRQSSPFRTKPWMLPDSRPIVLYIMRTLFICKNLVVIRVIPTNIP